MRDPSGARVSFASSAVFLLTLALLLALGLLKEEVWHYGELLDLPGDDPVRILLSLVVLAKTAAALGLGVAPVLLLASLRRLALARAWGVGWVLVVTAYLALDLRVQRLTGNHLWDYAAYLREPDALRWMGGRFSLLGFLSGAAIPALAVGLLALGSASFAKRLSDRPETSNRQRRVAGCLLGLWTLIVAAGPASECVLAGKFRFSWAPANARTRHLLSALAESLPWRLGLALPSDPGALQARTQALYLRYQEHLHARGPMPPAPTTLPERTPNLVLIALDSLRHDALTPEVMPRMWDFSKRGVRLDRHYAATNGSHYGLFALLYGRFPLEYFSVLDSGIPPTLPTLAAAWGYECHLFTSAQLDWIEMERFLGPPHFEVHAQIQGPDWRKDQETLRAASRVLDEPGPPRLVVVFLMSTHLDYDSPPGPEVFRPAAPPPDWTRPVLADQRPGLLNRYRNSAHFLDSLLGDWLEGLELDRNLVVVTGDHGESIFDDGILAHSSRLSEIQTRVPFIMAGPGIRHGRAIHEPTSHLDVLPTVLARLGLQGGAGTEAPGRDFLSDPPDPAYVPLIMVQRRGHSRDQIAFVGSEGRFGVRLFRDRKEIRFLGALDEAGRPRPEPVDANGERVFLSWFRDFLSRNSLPGGSSRASAATRHTSGRKSGT